MSKFKRILRLAEINYVNARNPDRHVPNRNNIRFNTMFILKLVKDDGKMVRNLFGLQSNLRDELLASTFEIVKQIPLLSKSRIKKFLGNGMFGAVFELDSGRVLKIGKALSSETSREVYSALLFKDEDIEPELKNIPMRNTLPVFDSGMVKRDKYSWQDRNLKWSEIPLIKMLDDQQKRAWDEISRYIDECTDAEEIEDAFYRIRPRLIDTIGDKDSIMNALKATLALEGDLGDTHADNVGQFIQTGEFVVFDN